MISQEVITVVGVDNLTSLTTGWGLLSAVVVVGVFGVAVVVIDDDGFSITGLGAVIVTAGFDGSVTTGVPPEMVT